MKQSTSQKDYLKVIRDLKQDLITLIYNNKNTNDNDITVVYAIDFYHSKLKVF